MSDATHTVRILKLLLHCFLPSTVSSKKWVYTLIIVALYARDHFSLATFKIFFLSLIFIRLTMMCLNVVLFVLIHLCVRWGSWIYELLSLTKFEKYLIFLSVSFFHCLPSSEIPITHTSVLFILSCRFLWLLIFFSLFSPLSIIQIG